MILKKTSGDFHTFGCVVRGELSIFTYSISKPSPSGVLLFDKKSHRKIGEYYADWQDIFGRVVSIAIQGIDWEHTVYLLDLDDEVVVDPYARLIYGREKWRDESRQENCYQVYGGPIYKEYSWKDKGSQLKVPEEKDIMLRLHLRGLTMGTGLGEDKRGNYKGLMSRLKSMADYGITLLEIQPLYDFEELRYLTVSNLPYKKENKPKAEAPYGVNYWGYGPADYFAPKSSFFGGEDQDLHMKEMVEAIHNHGMKLVMEFSFEGNQDSRFIIDCLRYWAKEYHVDGFRLLGMGLPMDAIRRDPFLSKARIYSDQLDYGLLSLEDENYRHLYVENADFLYPLRKLQNHMDGSITEFANMMRRQNKAYGFVNYAASTLGFTLRDVYSYSEKHNEDNGEDNRDGMNYNFCHNYGVEGDSNSRNVINERMRHIRMALATVLMAQGIPMIQAGDTFGNTQKGNNNAYGQDNEIGWVTYSKKKNFRDLHAYIGKLIAFRKAHPILSSIQPKELSDYRHMGLPDLSYHDREPWTPWLTDDRKSIGILYCGEYSSSDNKDDIYLCFNFYFEEVEFALPTLLNGKKWHYLTNTCIADWNESKDPLEKQDCILVPGGSLTVLLGKKDPKASKDLKDSKKKNKKVSKKRKK